MGKTICICNQKGGTGKTTTSVNLAYALACLNQRILLIDIDPQGNATSGIGVNKNELKTSIYDVLLNRCSAKEALLTEVCPHLDLIPCNINLTGAEIELVGVLSRETRLKKAMAAIADDYDFILIDSPPSLGLLTLNALVASQSIIIPIQCEFYALEGVSQLLNTINLVQDGLNTKLAVEGVLLTMADFRTNLTTEVINEIRSFFGDKVYSAIIPRNIKLSEAPSYGKPIILYDPHSLGAKRYAEMAQEVLERNRGADDDKSMDSKGLDPEANAGPEVPDLTPQNRLLTEDSSRQTHNSQDVEKQSHVNRLAIEDIEKSAQDLSVHANPVRQDPVQTGETTSEAPLNASENKMAEISQDNLPQEDTDTQTASCKNEDPHEVRPASTGTEESVDRSAGDLNKVSEAPDAAKGE